MSYINSAYSLTQVPSEYDLKFFFISKGTHDIIKVAQYAFVQELNGSDIYNLGFGDYNLEDDTIVDDTNTNNGDAYKVFNTVLSTIPIFFEKYPAAVLMVQGSDGNPSFIEKCRAECLKKCGDFCKNYNRRISIYGGYIDKNFEELNKKYQFLGGTTSDTQEIVLEDYQYRKKYNSVLLYQKSHNFTL